MVMSAIVVVAVLRTLFFISNDTSDVRVEVIINVY